MTFLREKIKYFLVVLLLNLGIYIDLLNPRYVAGVNLRSLLLDFVDMPKELMIDLYESSVSNSPRVRSLMISYASSYPSSFITVWIASPRTCQLSFNSFKDCSLFTSSLEKPLIREWIAR